MSTRTRAAALILPLAVLAACGTGADEPSGGADTSACAPVSGPMAEVNHSGDEPQLRVPQPDGWERNTQMDSELIRLALTNPSLATESFAPNLIVTAEPSSPDPQVAFDMQLDSMREGLGVSDLATTEGQLCGHPVMTIEYTLPPRGGLPERAALMQALVVPDGDESVTYTFTAQAAAPVDSSYEQEVQTMLEGVQVSD